MTSARIAAARRTAGRSRGGPVAASVALAVVLSMAGCSGATPQPTPPPGIDFDAFEPGDGNGLWLVTNDALLDAVVQAMRDGGPVTMRGSMTELVQPDPESDAVPGRTLGVDYLGRADAFSAKVTAGDVRAEFVVDDGVTHATANAAYAKALERPSLAGAVECTVGSDPALEAFDPVLDPTELVSSLLDGSLLGVNRPTDDTESLEVTIGNGDAVIGVLTVDRFGPPLPRSIALADASGDASFSFDGWGEPVDLAALPCP